MHVAQLHNLLFFRIIVIRPHSRDGEKIDFFDFFIDKASFIDYR